MLLLPFNALRSPMGQDTLFVGGAGEDLYVDLAWNQLAQGVALEAFGGECEAVI